MNSILRGTIADLVTDFLYYDRKEDEDLPLGSIEEMILSRETTIDEIVETFRADLIDGYNG